MPHKIIPLVRVDKTKNISMLTLGGAEPARGVLYIQ